jgi:hypothetical protein
MSDWFINHRIETRDEYRLARPTRVEKIKYIITRTFWTLLIGGPFLFGLAYCTMVIP